MPPRSQRPPTRENPVDPESVGARIRALRKERGYSQEYLAELVGTSQPQISEIERGYNERPEADTLIRLAQALGVSPSELYERSRFPGLALAGDGLRNEIRRGDVDTHRTLEVIARLLNRGDELGQLSPEDLAKLERLDSFLHRIRKRRSS